MNVTAAVRQPLFLNVIVPSLLAGAENENFVFTCCFGARSVLGAAGTRRNAPGATFKVAGLEPVCRTSADALSGFEYAGINSGGNIVRVPIGPPIGVLLAWSGIGRPSPI